MFFVCWLVDWLVNKVLSVDGDKLIRIFCYKVKIVHHLSMYLAHLTMYSDLQQRLCAEEQARDALNTALEASETPLLSI